MPLCPLMSIEKWTEPDRDAEALAEGFFSQPPPALLDSAVEAWEAAPMSAANRRAMLATLGLLGGCAAAAVAFALLSDHVMVAPARLAGAANPVVIESWTPKASESAPAAAQQIALVAAPRAAAPPEDAPADVSAPEVEVAPAAAKSVREAPAPTAPAVPESEADTLTKRAYRELGRGDAREAEHLANLALMQDGSSAGTYIVLAGARDALGNAEGARSAIRACVLHAKDRLAATCKTLAR